MEEGRGGDTRKSVCDMYVSVPRFACKEERSVSTSRKDLFPMRWIARRIG